MQEAVVDILVTIVLVFEKSRKKSKVTIPTCNTDRHTHSALDLITTFSQGQILRVTQSRVSLETTPRTYVPITYFIWDHNAIPQFHLLGEGIRVTHDLQIVRQVLEDNLKQRWQLFVHLNTSTVFLESYTSNHRPPLCELL